MECMPKMRDEENGMCAQNEGYGIYAQNDD